MKKSLVFILILSSLAWVMCKKDKPLIQTDNTHTTTPYKFPQPTNFRIAPIDTANLLTEEGVDLGHYLFFDPRLSKDNTISCSTCHLPEFGFSDPDRVSVGVGGALGRRHSMKLFNLAWSKQFFWDGRATTLREQALHPVEDPNEMNTTWPEVLVKLQADERYQEKFKKAFGTELMTKELVAKALEQYVKTLVVANSPFDKFIRGEGEISAAAKRGYTIFNNETADCFHCHSTPELFVHPAQVFSNNGLDLVDNTEGFADKGLGEFTGNAKDNGVFKIPSLRNLIMTAPYMHDGRFNTLEEVIDFYNEGPNRSPSLDPIMIVEANRRVLEHNRWGLGLTEGDKEDLKAYLLSLTDSTYLSNPHFLKPDDM